ncbi:MAG TPA: hypothetical protein VGM53_35070 [Streptosporangiaceae bacterium]|jgi:hypothetical protein
MSAPDDSAAGLAGHLRAAIADLDGYIERRAAELAAPHIADARARAPAEAGQLRAELGRRGDLVAELRQRIEGLEDRLDDLRVMHGERRDARVAARRQDRVGALPPDSRPLPSVAVYDDLLPSRRAHKTTG